MPSTSAARLASPESSIEQQPREPVRNWSRLRESAMWTPTTSCPASTARAAATAESTPPDRAARTRTRPGYVLRRGGPKPVLRRSGSAGADLQDERRRRAREPFGVRDDVRELDATCEVVDPDVRQDAVGDAQLPGGNRQLGLHPVGLRVEIDARGVHLAVERHVVGEQV